MTLGVIGGGLWGFYQYDQLRQSQRVERTMAYIQRYEEGSTAIAVIHMRTTLRAYVEQFNALQADGVSASDRRDMILTIADENVDGRSIADDLDAIAQFYQSLKTCIDENLCDARVGRRYFSDPARELWIDFRPYFEERRKNNQRYAAELEALADLGSGTDAAK